jgi:DNA polymerase-1
VLLTVHDELLFEAPPAEVEVAERVIRDAMETAFPMSVPLSVELHHGATWAELK